MKNPPAFQLYAQDFLADSNVSVMNAHETGVYCRLLLHCWIEDGLPDDEEYLKDLSKGGDTTLQPWSKTWAKVRRCFYEKEGRLRNKRLDIEREKQIRWREKSAKGGRKAAKNKGVSKGGSRVVQGCRNDPSSLQSSSSSSSLKEETFIPVSFEEFWKLYPRKQGKQDAVSAFKAIVKKESIADIMMSLDGYLAVIDREQTPMKFIKLPATFLRSERWKDYLPERRLTVDEFKAKQQEELEGLRGKR